MTTFNLTNAQRNLLTMLVPKSGVIFIRGEDAETAISLAKTPLVALGPTEASGAVAVLITAEGRAALAAE